MSASFRTNCTINGYEIKEKICKDSNQCVGIRIVNLQNDDWVTRKFDGSSMQRDSVLTHTANLCENENLNWKQIKENF